MTAVVSEIDSGPQRPNEEVQRGSQQSSSSSRSYIDTLASARPIELTPTTSTTLNGAVNTPAVHTNGHTSAVHADEQPCVADYSASSPQSECVATSDCDFEVREDLGFFGPVIVYWEYVQWLWRATSKYHLDKETGGAGLAERVKGAVAAVEALNRDAGERLLRYDSNVC